MKIYCFILYLFYHAIFSNKVCSQSVSDSVQNVKKTKKLRVVGMALPGRDPEYGFYAQGGIIGLFKTNQKDTSLRTSNIYLFGLYSQYNQWRLSNGGDIFTKNENYFINYWYYISHLPSLFFGLGNNTDPKNYDFIDYHINFTNTNIYRRVYKKLFVGISQFYENVYSIDDRNSELFIKEVSKKWIGQTGYEAFGFGPKLRWDSRNNVYSAQSGKLFEIGMYQYYITGKVKAQHQRFYFDYRIFKSLDSQKRHVLAFQIFAEQVNSDIVPFVLMPSLNVRAYHINQFKTKAISTFQAEYRARVWKALGFSLFGGVSNCSNALNVTDVYSVKPNMGMGIRVRLDKKDNLNVRLEYGIGSNTNNLYLAFYDAF